MKGIKWWLVCVLILCLGGLLLTGYVSESDGQTVATDEPIIATAEDMWVSNLGNPASSLIGGQQYSPYNLIVELKPTKAALPDHKYLVELYENGKYRDTVVVDWNQPEINVLKEKLVRFPIAREEFSAYYMENISHIFSVKVIGKSPKMGKGAWEKLTGGSQ